MSKVPQRRGAGPKADGLPLYRHMHNDLRQRIQEGEFPRGGAIPSERELRAHYGVSAITVKRAVAELALEGLVVTARGQRTRVVSRVGATHYGTSIDGLIKGLQQQSRNAAFELLDLRMVKAAPDIAHALHLDKNPRLQRIALVVRRNGEPYCYWLSYVPERLSKTIPRELLTRKFRLLLYHDFGIRPHRGSQVFSACPATKEVAAILRVKVGSPLLMLTRTLFDDRERAIEYTVSYFPGERYEYAMELGE